MKSILTKHELRELLNTKLSHNFGMTPETADNTCIYKALVLVLRDEMTKLRKNFKDRAMAQQSKQVFYLCMEFLMGQSLKNTLFNLGLTETAKDVLAGYGIKLEKLYDEEPDAGLGNGGLGRLAACFLDGLATTGYPAMGYSIRYEYGIFRQKLVDGWQTELPDFWLPGGGIWLEQRRDRSLEVHFEGRVEDSWDDTHHICRHTDYSTVTAVPFDLMVAGLDGKAVSVLRLFAAEAPQGFDMAEFNSGNYMRAVEQASMAGMISKVLYPADNHPEGKSLRLRQQYFLVSAAIQDIVQNHLAQHGTLDNLPEKAAIHLNDTHPTLVVPELMRLLLDECGYDWDTAWDLVTRTVAYTNHTVMSEALECWGTGMFESMLPRIYQIVREIDNRHRHATWCATQNADMVERMAIISNGAVRMANLAVVAAHKVNGVSRLHSEILKNDLFHDFYTVTPNKFTNVTNGIAHRRWLCQANPKLSGLISSLIGDDFIKNADALEGLLKYRDDATVLEQLAQIKRDNKIRLSNVIKKQNGILVDPDSIFDMQVKRMHEYKRQHLNALHILSQYLTIKENPNLPFTPKTYIFGAKAASGYYMAKEMIQLICYLSKMIEADEAVRDKLRVVYLEDYRVSLAECMIPAAEISEQISLAGTEASGTGNMKLMLNGAITLGTEDGANVEIHEAVGDENILIFGMREHEVTAARKAGYHPYTFYQNNADLHRALDALNSNLLGKKFDSIAQSLLNSDPYMVLADYSDYAATQARASALYVQQKEWQQMSLTNIAKAGCFAADRSIRDYANGIWDAKPVK